MPRPSATILARLACGVALLIGLCFPTLALAAGTIRTVLVIDASSSMLSTDPKELRKVAAELFVDMARDGDQIAVTGFDGAVRESTGGFTTIKSVADRDKIKAAIRAVGKNGNWTDFTAGLGEARRLFEPVKSEAGDQEIVLFLTDGKCELDPKLPLAKSVPPGTRMEAFCQAKVLDEIIPALKRARIYAVGLSKGAPKDFIAEVGRKGRGHGVTTVDANDLPHLFADVYARLLGSKLSEGPPAGSIPITVVEGALSLDLVIVGPPAATVSLVGPTGDVVRTDNAKPEEAYFVEGRAYHFFKVSHPAPGTWTLRETGPGSGRYAALQNLELDLRFVDLPSAIEVGHATKVRVKLATPGGKMPPVQFLDKHEVTITSAEAQSKCLDALASATGAQAMKRGADGIFEITVTPGKKGEICFASHLTPGPNGVLTRSAESPVVKVVSPLKIAADPLDFGRIKQGSSRKAKLGFGKTEIGATIEVALSLSGKKGGLEVDPDTVELEPSGARSFEIELEVDKDAAPGARTLKLEIVPKKPAGFEERRISVDLSVFIVELTFWERWGFWIQLGAGALVALILLLGVVLPARFRKGSVLHYLDARDPDLPREGSYPLAAKAKAGLYRGARVRLAATGPVRAGGVIELHAAGGGGVIAHVLGGGRVVEKPREDPDGFAAGEPRPVTLTKKAFRVAPGARYEIEGSGLTFWYTLR